MIVSLKQSIPYVKKSCSQVSINGEFLKKEIQKCILNLKETGFKVCAVIEDDHSANANVVHNVPILYPLKTSKKTFGFLMLQVSIKQKHWEK